MSTNRFSVLLQAFRRFLWVCVIGFMIAWHNVYFQDDRLREEDRIEQTQLEEDEERESGDRPTWQAWDTP